MRLHRTTYYLYKDCLPTAPLPESHHALILQGLVALQQQRPHAKYNVIEHTPAEEESTFAFYDFSQPWPERQEGLRYRLEKEDGLVTLETTVLGYGCGQGADVAELQRLGIPATGWDPVHRPYPKPQEADVVNLGYVINVIENPAERL